MTALSLTSTSFSFFEEATGFFFFLSRAYSKIPFLVFFGVWSSSRAWKGSAGFPLVTATALKNANKSNAGNECCGNG